MKLLFVAVIVAVLGLGCCDTPANCTYDDVQGTWKFYISKDVGDRTMDCSKMGSVGSIRKINLKYPDLATDEFGNEGFWTMVYNQGFEVVIAGRKFFAFSKYKGSLQNATSYCDQTMPGWSHDVVEHQWSCYYGEKLEKLAPKATHLIDESQMKSSVYKPNPDYIRQLNEASSTWKATIYAEYEGMHLIDLHRRNGGSRSRVSSPGRGLLKEETKMAAVNLPESWDWRNVDGVDFVSPVRNQGGCGSCYAFSSMAMNEARIRVMSNNTQMPVFSPQDIVDCCQYSQGCDGGFPYLVGGKYAEDFGLVDESCDPYVGEDRKCKSTSCSRRYATRYRYVGGYYGACNEQEMKLALQRGPLSVSFMVYDDFMHYKSGVYRHSGLTDKYNPFEITNHAVLLVGYGADEGTKYWIVKNSWGKGWGEEGYFRILRGADECAIESIAVETFPVL
ncbi:hypothetical protein CAPTEDRAFT_138389 [Capitella teleta]|uniref:Dipeptidyl peptidase 1 n=1 Tax=Capitella teleta TaxID=283909 RepID=R7TF36_CAPTE|nr:hypothetical protein CAPTEDRAFT_138389 [Capitella teleta]|eukprot:ELT90166.1 hypothetical protein CAPTEDRAFT_138389 [Capitella teleta]